MSDLAKAAQQARKKSRRLLLPKACDGCYRRGYLRGVILGDGVLKRFKDHRRANSWQHHFRLAMIDEESTRRVARYLQAFGIEVQSFVFAMAAGEQGINAIRTHRAANFHAIHALIQFVDSSEFSRGFLAGFFDAEGSNSGALRFHNSSVELLANLETALTRHGFRYVYDAGMKGLNGNVKTLRMLGGIREHLRFFQLVDPAIRRKLPLDGTAIKTDADTRIVSIRATGVEQVMYDITTGTEDFIANGVVSHNCYARDIANRFYKQGFEPSIYPHRLTAPGNTKVPEAASTDMAYRNIFTCSMADLFGRWVPAQWIEAVLEQVRANPQWNFLFLTKFPKRMAEFDFPTNAWLGTSVDCQARVKAAEDAFAKISGGTKWLSVEPMLEPLQFNRLSLFNWVVIGGASKSNQTPEWVPPIDWVADLHMQARKAGCRVYYKTNCGMHDSLRIREYPWQEPVQKVLPAAFKYLGMK